MFEFYTRIQSKCIPCSTQVSIAMFILSTYFYLSLLCVSGSPTIIVDTVENLINDKCIRFFNPNEEELDEDFVVEKPPTFKDNIKLQPASFEDRVESPILKIDELKYEANFPASWLENFTRDELIESDRLARFTAEKVRGMMQFVWENYKNTAWGADEMNPITGGPGIQVLYNF